MLSSGWSNSGPSSLAVSLGESPDGAEAVDTGGLDHGRYAQTRDHGCCSYGSGTWPRLKLSSRLALHPLTCPHLSRESQREAVMERGKELAQLRTK